MSNLFPQIFNVLAPTLLIILLAVYFVLFFYMFYRGKYLKEDKFDRLYLKLSEEIKYAVSPKFIELSTGVNELVELAVEIWRIEQRLHKCFPDISENHRKSLEISLEKLKRFISRYDMEILDHTNQKFNDGLNLDVLSIEKDPTLSAPVVKETIEPTVMLKGQVVRKAKIILLSNQ